MAPTEFLLIFSGLLFASPSCSLENPIDKISAQADFNSSRFAGKWYLDSVASECAELKDIAFRASGVNMVVSINETAPLTPLWISTFYPKEHVCWEIKHVYSPTKTPGRFLLTPGRDLPVDVVVMETDYTKYAIIFYQKSQKLTVKLYGRKRLDDMVPKIREVVASVGMTTDHLHFFPSDEFCHKANKFHILDETRNSTESL